MGRKNRLRLNFRVLECFGSVVLNEFLKAILLTTFELTATQSIDRRDRRLMSPNLRLIACTFWRATVYQKGAHHGRPSTVFSRKGSRLGSAQVKGVWNFCA